MTEFSASLAPRRKTKSSFLTLPSGPGTPMLPSASARFITQGMSTSVESATPSPILKPRSKKVRRERILLFCIGLLFVEALKSHEHRHHAADAGVIGHGRVAQDVQRRGGDAVVRGVQEVQRRGPVKI